MLLVLIIMNDKWLDKTLDFFYTLPKRALSTSYLLESKMPRLSLAPEVFAEVESCFGRSVDAISNRPTGKPGCSSERQGKRCTSSEKRSAFAFKVSAFTFTNCKIYSIREL